MCVRIRTEAADWRSAVEVAPGLVIPSPVWVRAEDVNGYDVALEVVPEGGRLVARNVSVQRRNGGPPITGEALRSIPVARLVRAAAECARLGHVQGEGDTKLTSVSPLGGEQVLQHARDAGPTVATLRLVAYVYKVALLRGDGPTKAVQDTFKIPRATAGRWVGLARERGILGPAEAPGKAGG